MRKAFFIFVAAFALIFAGFAENADARKGGGGFRGGGIKFRSGNFRSFKPMKFNRGFSRGIRHGRHKFTRHGWKGKQYGKHHAYKPYGKKGHGKHGHGKKGKHGKEYGHGNGHDRGHKWKKDYGKHHKGRDHRSYRQDFARDFGRGGGGSGFDASSIESLTSIVLQISRSAEENPDDTGTYKYRDRTSGQTVEFDHKACACGSDPYKIVAWLKERCESKGGTWNGTANLANMCLTAPPKSDKSVKDD